VQEHGNF
jgi:splicing factor 1